MIRVGGVTEPQQDRHERDQPDRGSVGVRGDEVVESEHRRSFYVTVGSDRRVMTRPSGDDRGRADGRESADEPALEAHAGEEAPGRDRQHADPGDDGRQTEAERHDQEQPEADAVEGDRGEQDDERGRAGEQAAGDSGGDQPARPVVVVVAVVVVVVVVVVCVPLSEPLPEHRHADADHEQRRDEVQPRVEVFGDDELGEGERHHAEPEDADRVRRP